MILKRYFLSKMVLEGKNNISNQLYIKGGEIMLKGKRLMFTMFLAYAMFFVGACASTTHVVAVPVELAIEEMSTMPVDSLTNRDIGRFLDGTRGSSKYLQKRETMLKALLEKNQEVPMPHLVDAIKLFNRQSTAHYFVLATCQYFQFLSNYEKRGHSTMRSVDSDFARAVYTWSLGKLGPDARIASRCSTQLLKIVDPGFIK